MVGVCAESCSIYRVYATEHMAAWQQSNCDLPPSRIVVQRVWPYVYCISAVAVYAIALFRWCGTLGAESALFRVDAVRRVRGSSEATFSGGGGNHHRDRPKLSKRLRRKMRQEVGTVRLATALTGKQTNKFDRQRVCYFGASILVGFCIFSPGSHKSIFCETSLYKRFVCACVCV